MTPPSSDTRSGAVAQGEPSFEQFVDVVETAILRAAWLLTADAVLATTLSEDALARTLRRWPPSAQEQPVTATYAHLVGSLPEHSSVHRVKVRATPDESHLAQQQRMVTAFQALPRPERLAVVLHSYANLSVHQVSSLLRASAKQIQERDDAAMRELRARSGEDRGIPWDSVACPAAPVDLDRIAALATATKRVSRRRLLVAGGGVLTASALGAAGWWASRPAAGHATLAKAVSELKPSVRSSGQIFWWLRNTGPRALGTGTLSSLYVSSPPVHLAIAGRPGALQVRWDGKPVATRLTEWGDVWFQLPQDANGNGPTVVQIAAVPPDTDHALTPVGDDNAVGIELPDHSTYAAVWVGSDQPSGPILWRTARQTIGVSSGEKVASIETADRATMIVLIKHSALTILGSDGVPRGHEYLDPLRATFTDFGQVPGMIASYGVLPMGATHVRCQLDPLASTAQITIAPVASGYTCVAAELQTTSEPWTKDPTFSVLRGVTWTAPDGTTSTWQKPKPELDPAVSPPATQ